MDVKLVRKALDERECEDLEMVLQHKSKLHICREVKREVVFEDYLEHVKGVASRLFSKVQLLMGCLRSWVGILIGVGHGCVLIVGLVRSHLSMFFLSFHHMIPRDNFCTT